ncbi:PEP-CTERM sorting domain-containing protein [Thalassotalea fusca]
MGFKTFLKRILAISTIAFAGSAAADNFKADGCFECDGESYDLGYTVNFNFDDGSTGEGAIYFGQDDSTGEQYLFFKMAEDYVDTIYHETSGHSSISDYASGKRDFRTLVQSDKLGNSTGDPLVFNTNLGTYELQVDLISCITRPTDNCQSNDKKYTTDIAGREFGSAGYNDDTAGYKKSTGTVHSQTGTAIEDVVLKATSSMDYNAKLDGFTVKHSLQDVENSGWLTYVGYEFKFAAGTFTNWITPDQDISSFLALGESHASPMKKLLNDTTITDDCIQGCVPTTDIPEPGSLALFGLAALGLIRVRNKKV